MRAPATLKDSICRRACFCTRANVCLLFQWYKAIGCECGAYSTKTIGRWDGSVPAITRAHGNIAKRDLHSIVEAYYTFSVDPSKGGI